MRVKNGRIDTWICCCGKLLNKEPGKIQKAFASLPNIFGLLKLWELACLVWVEHLVDFG